MNDLLKIGNKTFNSRLMLGTGKFANASQMVEAIKASGTQIVTVALRRVDASGNASNIIDPLLDLDIQLLPNTSGAEDAQEVIRMAHLATAMGLPKWVKIEVTPDPRTLLPDGIETLKAAQVLINEGYTVLPYINADPILAKKLEEIGCATIMPLAAPIGTNKGLTTKDQIQIIIEQASIPVVVDAGIGAPSHASEAFEIGADAILLNTAIAVANKPIEMANAFKLAAQAGRQAFKAGCANINKYASASSPITGLLDKLQG